MKQSNITPEVIPFESDQAASIKTFSGWVDREGQYFGNNERSARYSGCTHIRCADCGTLVEKEQGVRCHTCAGKRRKEAHAKLPQEAWNGADMLYSQEFDAYFHSESDIEDFIDGYSSECALKLEDLCLVICTPNYADQFDLDFHLEDVLFDGLSGSEISESLNLAVMALNKELAALPALSWSPGSKAPTLESIAETALTEAMCATEATKPAPASDESWIAWAGGKCPIDTRVQYRLRDGSVHIAKASELEWGAYGESTDIVAYRLSRDHQGGAA